MLLIMLLQRSWGHAALQQRSQTLQLLLLGHASACNCTCHVAFQLLRLLNLVFCIVKVVADSKFAVALAPGVCADSIFGVDGVSPGLLYLV